MCVYLLLCRPGTPAFGAAGVPRRGKASANLFITMLEMSNVAILLLVAVAASPARAYPALWRAMQPTACTAHPTTTHHGHAAPVADP